MATSLVEHVAPGEEQVVFSRTAGVVASKVSHMEILDPSNDWKVLESPHEDDAPPLTCQFNHRGTHFAVGDESGRIDLWSFVPLRLYVKSLDLSSTVLEGLLPPGPFVNNSSGKSSVVVEGEVGGAPANEENEVERRDAEHGWSMASVAWSRCSRYIIAAYAQRKKTWPDRTSAQLPGLVTFWNIVAGQVEGYLRLQSRVVHVSLSPRNPRRGSVCCIDGTSFVADFAATTLSDIPARGIETWFFPGGGKQERDCTLEGSCGSDVGVMSSRAILRERALGGRPATGGHKKCVHGMNALDMEEAYTCDISTNEDGDGTVGNSSPQDGCVPAVPAAKKPSNKNAGVAKVYQIWDPVRQTELFSASFDTASTPVHCDPSITADEAENDSESSAGRDEAGTCVDGSGRGDAEFDANGGCWEGRVSCAGNVGGIGSSGNGVSVGCKATNRVPVQAGRVAWCEDGKSLFMLSHEGNLLKVKVDMDGAVSLLARVDLHGGASPTTLQLSPEGDKILIATATKGLCLMPTDDLDISRAEFFGENFGTRGTKARFWGAATLGNIHGRGLDASGKRRLTVVGNPSRTRDDKTDLFFFDVGGGQPKRVDTPRREGVISLACSPQRPLLLFLCPTGEIYFREQVLKTDFPGPWYPSGYVLIDNNVDYLEAEDQLDTVVMTGPEGEVLSKTQAHEVVVPWQHEAVAEEEASMGGNKDEPVFVDGDENTELWVEPRPGELRWIPEIEDTRPSEGDDKVGSAGPRGSPRGAGQENSSGPLARLLDASPILLKEARKKVPAAGDSKMDVDKRRKLVPKMLQDLTTKKKKYDEEAVKRKRKQEETRAKAKRNREKRAAAEADKVAMKARAAADEASRQQKSEKLHGTGVAAAGVLEADGAVILHTATSCSHPNVILEKALTNTAHMDDIDQVLYLENHNSAALAAALSGRLATAGPDNWSPSTRVGTSLRGGDCGGPSYVGGAAADAAAWLAANASDGKKRDHDQDSASLPAPSTRGSCSPMPKDDLGKWGDHDPESRCKGERASAGATGATDFAAEVGGVAVSNEIMPTLPAFQGSVTGIGLDGPPVNFDGRSVASTHQRRRSPFTSGDPPDRSCGSRTEHAGSATENMTSASSTLPQGGNVAVTSAGLPLASPRSSSPFLQSAQLPTSLLSKQQHGLGTRSSCPSAVNGPHGVSISIDAVAHRGASSPVRDSSSLSQVPRLRSPDAEADNVAADGAGDAELQ